ncbi:acylphosphatase [Gemmatimonas sp.]|uniref:acylphosphatase n=1 Tax=Gemmatimonas sp. TaxID=1962908 RepID=UPI003DA5AE5D
MGQGTSRRFRVSGRVQGVGFRWFVKEEARRLELRGWVRNEPNGDVLLEAGGGTDALEELEALVRMGPPGAEVTRFVREAPDTLGDLSLPFPFAVHR